MEYEKLMEKAKGAKSAEELLALAKENDIGMTEEEAEETFAMLGKAESCPTKNLPTFREAAVMSMWAEKTTRWSHRT